MNQKGVRYIRWSKEEITLLRELYPKLWVKDLVKFFPIRNKVTIAAKALDLKLLSAKSWSQKDNIILTKHFVTESKETLLQLLPRRSWKAILARGERLNIKRNRHKPRLRVNESYFKKWSSHMAYILGFILTDGCIINGTYKGYSDALKFGVQLQDKNILEKIKHELSSEHTISFVRATNSVHFCITSQKIVDDLKILGISYRKSLREKMPKVPSKYLRDFLRGVFDGDGGISFQSTKHEYPTLSLCGGKEIITFIREHFLSKFKIYSTVGRRTRSKDTKYYLFAIAYRGNSAKTIIGYLYRDANLYLDRKFLLAKRCMDLQIDHRKDYTQKEDKLLTNLYAISSKTRMLSLLPNRSWSSIQQRTHMLKIYKYNIK